MSTTRIALLATALAAALAACSGATERKASFIRRGEQQLEQRNYDKARLEFRNALQIDPKDTRAQTLAAQAAEKVGEYAEAAQYYRAAMTDAANTTARAGLAKLMLFSGNTVDAKTLMDEGLATAPNDAALIVLRGALQARAGDSAAARADAEAALRTDPASEDAAALLASLLSQAGEFPHAIAVMERAIQHRPQSIDLHIILAQLHLNAGERPKAEAELQRTIEMDPATLVHRYRLAQFHLLGNNIDAAEAALKAAVTVAPNDPAPKLALAGLIASKRSFEQGETSLKQLVAANPKDLPLQIGLGNFYLAHAKPAAARTVFQAIVAADKTGPRGLEARNLLAAQALRAGKADEAKALVEAVLKASPRDAEALVLRANLALAKGDAPGAIADLRAVLRDQPSALPLLRALSQAYTANGDDSLAEETLRSAVQVNPRDIPTRLALAQLLIKTDRADEAQPVVDQLVTDQPGDVPSLEAAFQVQRARRDLSGARRSAAGIQAAKPESPMGHYLLGMVDEAEGKLDAARANFEEAVRLAPEAVEPLTAALRADMHAKQPDKAIARIDAVAARYPNNAAMHDLHAQVLLASRHFAAAAEAGERAIKLTPNWWQAYRTVALTQLAANKSDVAMAVYARGIKATNGAPELIVDYAQQQERLGHVDVAIRAYDDWLKREPQSDVAANNLAMLLVTHREKDVAALRRALELTEKFQASNNAAFADTLGWVRYLRGEYNESVPALQRAVDLAPHVAQLRAHLGLAQYKANQRSAAKSNLELAVQAAQKFPELDAAMQALTDLRVKP